MRPTLATSLTHYLQALAYDNELDIEIYQDALQRKYYLLFKRRDEEGQTLTVPVEDCNDTMEPLITGMKMGIALLGGPARG